MTERAPTLATHSSVPEHVNSHSAPHSASQPPLPEHVSSHESPHCASQRAESLQAHCDPEHVPHPPVHIGGPPGALALQPPPRAPTDSNARKSKGLIGG